MKMTKKVFAVAMLLVLICGGVFAQQSNTNEATAGVIKTDVDNYMNVNNFEKVQFGKFFTFINLLSSSSLDMGFAKKFGENYGALYYSGNLLKGLARTTTDDGTTKVKTDSQDTYNNLSAFYGIKGMGFRLNLELWQNNSENDATGKYKDIDQSVITTLQFGTNLKKNDLLIAPRVDLVVDVYTKKVDNEISATDTRNITNNGYTSIKLGGGAKITLPAKGIVNQYLDGYLSTAFNFYPETTAKTTVAGITGTTTQKKSYFNLGLIPTYGFDATYEKFNFGFKSSLGFSLLTNSTGEIVYNSNGVETTTGSKVSIVTTTINPTVAFGTSYLAVPKKMLINVGISVTLPNLVFKNTKTTPAGSDITTKKSEFNTSVYSAGLRTGFAWYITDKVTVDTSLDLFNSGVTTKIENIWTSAFNLLVSVKY